MHKYLSSLRVRLILLVLIATLPALVLTLFTGIEQRQQAAVAAQREAMRLVRLASVNQENLIENTRGFLVALSHSLALRDENLQGCQDVFSHLLVSHFPFYAAFYVADLNGNVLCSMEQGDLPGNLIECDHYQELVQADDFVVSRYHICRNSGKAVISMGLPLRNADDERVGVINVSVDLAWINDLARNAQLPPGSTLTVLDNQGVILAHYPDPENWLGEEVPEGTILDDILKHREGTAEALGPDGLQRLNAFIPLSGAGGRVFVNLGLPTEVAYAEANRTMRRNLILLGVVTFLALIAALLLSEFFVLRQTQSLVKTTDKLAAGDLSARTEIPYDQGELGQLAEAFDHMALALGERESERDRAEAAMLAYAADLERSNQELRDFTNAASHDMQEPLRKIRTFSELLSSRYSDSLDERGIAYLNRMDSAAERMHDLIIQLLAYSRITTKAQPFTQVDLSEVAKKTLVDLDLQIEQSKANLEVGDLPKIKADPTQMQQLLQNLISNALKFKRADETPHIQVYGEYISSQEVVPTNPHSGSPYCRIYVVDNGIGFDEKYLERIFQPFQRLHGIGEYDGSGMGLAICRKIVERHKGGITAQSSPGNGATFIITLPINPAEVDNGNGG
jgi:signal transduction histidine kinase